MSRECAPSTMLSREWFTASELAGEALPGMPRTKQGVGKWAASYCLDDGKRRPRGCAIEFHYSVLPTAAFSKIVRKYAVAEADPGAAAVAATVTMAAYTKVSDKKRDKAAAKLAALRAIDAHTPVLGLRDAIAQVAAEFGVSRATIYNWRNAVACLPRETAVAALVPQQKGRQVRAACDDDAWQFLLSLYLSLRRPHFSACFKEVAARAKSEGWTIPSEETLLRRIHSDVPVPVAVMMRDGPDALKRLYPYQERDRSMFHALEAVNADGHKWDVLVEWPDGTIGRPMMIAFQDLYSNLMLSWRVDKSENKEMVRLAFADLVRTYGIPKHCWLDNGRAFASKWLTGGIQNRFRFKIREEEPHGILPLLGTEVHWTLPYSGQSKPIERAFGEFAGNYAKHPKFNGAGTGNNPMNKPGNYGEKAIPLDVFLEVAATCVAEHNAREGRRTKVCGGRLSFQQAFNASYATSTIAKATPDHLQLLLLAAEGVRASARDGSFELQKNRYWSEGLASHRGQPIVVRFDPQTLDEAVQVYSLDGKWLCEAALQGAARFNDVDASRAHAQARGAWRKAVKAQAEAIVRMTEAEAAALTQTTLAPPAPETKVVRMFRGSLALAPDNLARREEETEDLFVAAVTRQREARGNHLTIVETQED